MVHIIVELVNRYTTIISCHTAILRVEVGYLEWHPSMAPSPLVDISVVQQNNYVFLSINIIASSLSLTLIPALLTSLVDFKSMNMLNMSPRGKIIHYYVGNWAKMEHTYHFCAEFSKHSSLASN